MVICFSEPDIRTNCGPSIRVDPLLKYSLKRVPQNVREELHHSLVLSGRCNRKECTCKLRVLGHGVHIFTLADFRTKTLSFFLSTLRDAVLLSYCCFTFPYLPRHKMFVNSRGLTFWYSGEYLLSVSRH